MPEEATGMAIEDDMLATMLTTMFTTMLVLVLMRNKGSSCRLQTELKTRVDDGWSAGRIRPKATERRMRLGGRQEFTT